MRERILAKVDERMALMDALEIQLATAFLTDLKALEC